MPLSARKCPTMRVIAGVHRGYPRRRARGMPCSGYHAGYHSRVDLQRTWPMRPAPEFSVGESTQVRSAAVGAIVRNAAIYTGKLDLESGVDAGENEGSALAEQAGVDLPGQPEQAATCLGS